MIFTKIDISVRTIEKLLALNFARANLLVENTSQPVWELPARSPTVILVAKPITCCLRGRLPVHEGRCGCLD